MDSHQISLRSAVRSDGDIFFTLFSEIQKQHRLAEPEFFRTPEKDEEFDAYFAWLIEDPHQYLIFCCIDGEAVGYIQYFLGLSPQTIYQPERRIAHVAQVFVEPNSRRFGLATKLIDHTLQEAKFYGASQVGLELWLFNKPAHACFEKAGFKMNQASMWQRL